MRCSSYDDGQCTKGACELAPWVEDDWGDAGQWAAAAAAAGFSETLIPTVGAIVVYAAGDGYSAWGHVAYVRQVYSLATFLVDEMNYVAWDQYDQRVSNMGDVAAFILAPGTSPGAGGPSGGRGGPGQLDRVHVEWQYMLSMWNVGLPQLRARALHLVDVAGLV